VKWSIPLETGGVIVAPFVVALIVSCVSPHFILDNPGFWYGYMGYIGTVALAGAALWQNQLYRIENKRKEELSIRPYLFSEIADQHIDFLADNNIEFLQINISDDNSTSVICASRNKPKDVVDYIVARQANRDFLAQPISDKIIQTARRTELLTKEIQCLCDLNKKYELVSYCLENHGAGSAVKIKMLLNEYPLVPLFCLSIAEKKQLYLLIDTDKMKAGSIAELKISVEFYNVEDLGPYLQEETLSIRKTTANRLGLIIDKQISSPKLTANNKEEPANDKT
jgi:hypothetical protein